MYVCVCCFRLYAEVMFICMHNVSGIHRLAGTMSRFESTHEKREEDPNGLYECHMYCSACQWQVVERKSSSILDCIDLDFRDNTIAITP